ncbi:hypothetical protein CRUP_032720 [Coryphaenoides rupestris]|nr:hypothetical protein CRUP_032720 [Coryphaenoides rupestris]
MMTRRDVAPWRPGWSPAGCLGEDDWSPVASQPVQLLYGVLQLVDFFFSYAFPLTATWVKPTTLILNLENLLEF